MPDRFPGSPPSDEQAGDSRPDNRAIGSLLVTLFPSRTLSLPGNGGQALHGLFLSLIGSDNPELASHLHDMPELKPFSLSPIEGECQFQNGRCLTNAGARVSFRMNLLETELLSKAVAISWHAQRNGLKLPLGGIPITIADVKAAPGPGFTSYQELLKRASSSREIAIEFLSPTVFRSEGTSLPFPEAGRVFTSLLRRWDAFSNLPLSPVVEDCLDSIVVSRYQLQTEILSFSKFKAIGFKGRVIFELPKKLSIVQIRALNCLADFAFYSGVGWKTTMGMGQSQRQEARSERWEQPLPLAPSPISERGPEGEVK